MSRTFTNLSTGLTETVSDEWVASQMAAYPERYEEVKAKEVKQPTKKDK